MNIQWYPGHMTKAKRAMEEDIRLVDLIIELLDARAPLASRNPDIDSLSRGKARLILLNKADLSDPRVNDAWVEQFRQKGAAVLPLDARSGAGLRRRIEMAVQEACRGKRERDRKRGIKNRPVRAMVAGIPNVGKSTFINSFAGKAAAKTGNRPGVTRGNQWIRLNPGLELLDTPGILWPKFDDKQTGLALALIGSVNDEILDKEELVLELLRFLTAAYPETLTARYGVSRKTADIEDGVVSSGGLTEYQGLLEEIAKRRGCLVKGGEPDCSRAAALVIDDFRSGKLGHISLETPENANGNRQ